jgi:hypothetical protein
LRANPVRQNNKDKPLKSRVDFFVLCIHSPDQYFIIPCDLNQGKNAENMCVSRKIAKLPITQKAVVDAIIQAKIAKESNDIQ